MPSPMPPNPWSRPRWRKRTAPAVAELVVPVASPQRQLHALRVTVKPHDWTREAIRHRLEVDGREGAEQPWRPEWADRVKQAAHEAARRLKIDVEVSEPAADQPRASRDHLRVRFAHGTPEGVVRAVAAACSMAAPQTWFRLDRLAVLGGRFYRRERGYRLHLRQASDIHLPREVRSNLRDLLARPSPEAPQHAGTGSRPGRPRT